MRRIRLVVLPGNNWCRPVAVAAHHEEVCTKASAFCDQYVGSIVFLADRAIFDGVDAMMPEVLHGIIGLQRIRLGLMLTFHDEKRQPCSPGANRAEIRQARAPTPGFRSRPRLRCATV